MLWIILLIVVFFLAGIVVGFYVARRYMKNYLKNNPPIKRHAAEPNDVADGSAPVQEEAAPDDEYHA